VGLVPVVERGGERSGRFGHGEGGSRAWTDVEVGL
jgi:hypothetical protein